MGCGPSRRASSLDNLNDSRHVMQIRDMKLLQKQGHFDSETIAPPAFKPRAEDIMIKPKAISTNTVGLITKHIQKKMIDRNNGDCCTKNKEYHMGHIMMASQVQLRQQQEWERNS